ncbi:membrane dipeptidase [Ruminococcaceae bacterium OttesenSCG-928-L11]|nr:membrane dipeptidase [Ruminococcaceae bacterium OttesenSCG-928-L11]
METPIKVVDLHCDTLTACHKKGIGLSNDETHLSLHKRPASTRWCQCMAVFIPDSLRGQAAEAYFGEVYQYLTRQQTILQDSFAWLKDLSLVPSALNTAGFSAVLTVEGGAVLAGKLENIKKLRQLGVRMLTLTWNAANEICGGSETDEGFTAFGRRAVAELERQGIVVDVSHLSDRGFDELREFARKPFVASHSNSRTVCGHRRNLTDAMFCHIRDIGGLVGMNYYQNFITEDGKSDSIDDLLRHIHHFLELGGEHTLALGSDYDGAEIPSYLDSMEKVESLYEAMVKSGIAEPVVNRIFYGNAERFFTAYDAI